MVDFKKQLARQLSFIESSCLLYDEGNYDESIRIATNIRVIFHNTSRSISLLVHLNAINTAILSTCAPVDLNDRTIHYDGISLHSLHYPYKPRLGETVFHQEVPFEDWWKQVILIINGVKITRKSLVLDAANKDGGAHVDQALPASYEAMQSTYHRTTIKDMGLPTQKAIPLGVFDSTHLVALRQLGYEVLNSSQLVDLIK
jgi:hypothetical protein